MTFASFVVVADAFCSPSACSRERRGQDPGQLFGGPPHLTKHFAVSCDHLQNRRIVTTSRGCCWPGLGICSFCPSCCLIPLVFCFFLLSSSGWPGRSLTMCLDLCVLFPSYRYLFSKQSDSFGFPCGVKGNECDLCSLGTSKTDDFSGAQFSGVSCSVNGVGVLMLAWLCSWIRMARFGWSWINLLDSSSLGVLLTNVNHSWLRLFSPAPNYQRKIRS